MTSVRTEYYKKRVDVLRECVNMLMDMLMLPKEELRSYSLIEFKKLHQLLKGDFHGSIIFQRAFIRGKKDEQTEKS